MNTKLKRLLAITLALAMALSLAACGKNDDPSATKAPDSSGQTPEYAYTASFTPLQVDEDLYLYPQLMTQDGYYSTSSEKVGENIPEGVTPEYEGQYDVYQSFLYFVSYDGSYTKLENYQPLDAPENEQGLRDFSSASYIGGMALAEDGKLAVLEMVNTSWSEAPEGVSRNDDSYWDYYKYESQYHIRWLDDQGNILSSAPVVTEPDTYLNTYSMAVDSNGNVVTTYNGMNGGTDILAIAPDGSFASTIHSDEYLDMFVKLAGGRMAVSYYGDNGYELAILDMENGRITDEIYDLGYDVNLYGAVAGTNGYDLYYTSGSGFYGLKLESGEKDKIFSWLDCDVNGSNVSTMSIGEDGTVRTVLSEYDRANSQTVYQIVTVSRVPYDQVPHKDTVTMAVMYTDYYTTEAVIAFNRRSDSVRIQVLDYSEYNTEDDSQAGLTKLNTEIMAGKMPDILSMSGLNYTQLASKGLLEDLYPYIDADSELDRGDFFPNLLSAMEVDGKLCSTVSSFYISTVLGASSVVGDEPGWTFDEFQAALASMPQGCQPFDPYVTRADMLNTMVALEMDSLVDWSTGQCSFDSQLFKDILEFAALFPEDYDWENSDNTSSTDRLASGMQMLTQATLYSLEDMFYNDYEQILGKTTYIGFPCSEGVGSVMGMSSNAYAMSASSQYKDQIWQFLRTFFTKDYQKSSTYGLPSRMDLFEDMAEEATTVQYEQDNEGNYILDENGDRIPQARFSRYDQATGEWVDAYAMEQEDVDMLRQVITSTTRLANYSLGDQIYSMVGEEAQAFFAGQKSVDEVARLVQSKANIYVNEQR